VIDDELFVVLILEYQCKACWNRYCLVILDIGECVVICVDGNVIIDFNVLFAEGDFCIWVLFGIFEVIGDCCWVGGKCFCGCVLKYGVRVVYCCDACWIMIIVCGVLSCSCSCYLIFFIGLIIFGCVVG